jgi:hypothetical protein
MAKCVDLLVGGFKHFLFPIIYIYGIIRPIDFHIFQDGYCTTNQVLIWCFKVNCPSAGAQVGMISH